jgi:hypothetical protein
MGMEAKGYLMESTVISVATKFVLVVSVFRHFEVNGVIDRRELDDALVELVKLRDAHFEAYFRGKGLKQPGGERGTARGIPLSLAGGQSLLRMTSCLGSSDQRNRQTG